VERLVAQRAAVPPELLELLEATRHRAQALPVVVQEAERPARAVPGQAERLLGLLAQAGRAARRAQLVAPGPVALPTAG
jgi:hypothetical protein